MEVRINRVRINRARPVVIVYIRRKPQKLSPINIAMYSQRQKLLVTCISDFLVLAINQSFFLLKQKQKTVSGPSREKEDCHILMETNCYFQKPD